MKTKVKGKIIENTYCLKNNLKEIKKDDESKFVYTARPELIKETRFVDWKDICEFSGYPYYNSKPTTTLSFNTFNEINISENETVHIDKEIFRADLNELHLFTNKIVEETDKRKRLSEEEFESELASFNEQMIESNEKLLSYCKLHKLNPRETDVIELFKLVYSHSNYEIINGVMFEKSTSMYSNYADISAISTLSSSAIVYGTSIGSSY